MAVKGIFSIEVDDGKFRQFKKLFDEYQSALKKSPAAWAMVNKNIDGSRDSFKKLVDQMAAANVQEKLRAKAQERADQITRTAADRWQSMARTTKEFARNIGDATSSLLKWASITGVISGLIGAGGLFGIDRLALGAASSRRSALGLGASIGGQEAFKANFGRLIDTDSFLQNVAGAKFDVQKRTGLIGAGLSPGQIAGDTAQTAIVLLRRLKQIADTTNPALFAQVLQARRLDQFAQPTDLERLKNTSPAEFEQLIKQYSGRSRQFNLSDDVAKRWQDFVTQLDNAGKSIETTLVKGLVNLSPGLIKLSSAVERIAGTMFEKGGTLEQWVTKIDDALEKFANYIGTDQFNNNVRDFVNGIGKIASAIGWAVSLLPDPGGKTGHHPNFGHRHRKTAEEAALDQLGMFGSIFGPSGAVSKIVGGRDISFDDLVGMVRKREGSGDNAISPKGAIGRYQIMPGTARQYGGDPSRLNDPAYNEQVARKILTDLAKKYHGNVSEILAGYNAGPGGADKFRAYGDNPSALPKETQKYIQGTQGLHVTIENNTGGNAIVSTNALKN